MSGILCWSRRIELVRGGTQLARISLQRFSSLQWQLGLFCRFPDQLVVTASLRNAGEERVEFRSVEV